MQTRALHKQGKSLRAIACEVGCSVNIIRKYLVRGWAPIFKARVPRVIKLASFEVYLRQRVAAAAPRLIPVTVLWREIWGNGRYRV